MLLFLMIIGIKLETVLLFLQKYVYSKIHLTANKPMTINYFYALTIFHHVANTNSFTATASQLGLAVSSVTRQIDNLEQSLQVKLLNRSTRHLDLTHAGMRYLQQTEPILAELQQVNEAIKEEQIEPQGRLCVGPNAMTSSTAQSGSPRCPRVRISAPLTDKTGGLPSNGCAAGP